MTPHHVTADKAPLIRDWLATRGGLAIWDSVNLSNPGASWTTPLHNADGTPAGKPTWQAATVPARVITDPAEVMVDVPRLVKRFHVAVRQGSNGLMLKLTDASTRKVRAAVAKAGEAAWYEFSDETQEALIFVADRTVPLPEFAPEGAR